MVSRLFGKLDAQRQRVFGSEGVCATAWATARLPAAATAPRPRNLRRFMDPPTGLIGAISLTLTPRQAGLAPAVHRVAMLLPVLVAFEAFEDVVGFFPAGAHRRLRGGMRARAGTAEEHHRLVLADR